MIFTVLLTFSLEAKTIFGFQSMFLGCKSGYFRRKKLAHTASGSKGGRSYFDRTKYAEASPKNQQRPRKSEQWQYLERGRSNEESQASKGSGWYEGPQRSSRRLDDDHEDSGARRRASDSQLDEPREGGMSSRGLRRATGAGRGSDPAARSGW